MKPSRRLAAWPLCLFWPGLSCAAELDGVAGLVLLSGFWKSSVAFHVAGTDVGLPGLVRDAGLVALTARSRSRSRRLKAIAEDRGVAIPGFFGYMLWSGAVLIPLFILMTFIWFK